MRLPGQAFPLLHHGYPSPLFASLRRILCWIAAPIGTFRVKNAVSILRAANGHFQPPCFIIELKNRPSICVRRRHV